MLNGQCSGICGEASYRGKRLTLAERGRNGHLKKKKMMMMFATKGGLLQPPLDFGLPDRIFL